MYYWDVEAKNKVKTFHFSKVPITDARINIDGTLIAYSLGYDYHRGVEGMN